MLLSWRRLLGTRQACFFSRGFPGRHSRPRGYRPQLEALEDRTLLSASYASTVLADGPVGYWRLGEAVGAATAVDASPNGNNGAYQSGVTQGQPGVIVGDPNTAAAFNGTGNARVDLPTATQLGLDNASFTAVAWVNAAALGGDHAIFGTDSGGTNSTLHLIIRGNQFYMGFYSNDTGGNQVLNTGQWYFVAFDYNYNPVTMTGTQSIYVNGALDASTAGHVAFMGTTTLHIGQWGGGNNFNGVIDEPAIFDYALTPAQIQGLYNAGEANDVSLSSSTVSVSETAGTIPITIVRPSQDNLARTDTVYVSTSDNSAVAGVDYTALNNVPVTFSPGQTTATVSVSILNNSASRPNNRTFNVNLSNPSNGLDIFPIATEVVTITNGPAPARPIIVVGTDVGAAPEVRVFDAKSGALKFDFYAYNPAFTGGVRVAAGDVNGDGVPDIITGAGPGMSPEVKVFNGRTGALLLDFFAYSPFFTGGIFVASGDLNGDGFDDIVVGPDAGSLPEVKAFSGRTGALLVDFFAYNPFFTGGVRVAAGDINGDGRADIITGPGRGMLPEVRVFSRGFMVQDYFAVGPLSFNGIYVAAGYFSPNGPASVIVGTGAGDPPQVREQNNIFLPYPIGFTGGVRVGAVADLNNNGVAEILTAGGPLPGASPLPQDPALSVPATFLGPVAQQVIDGLSLTTLDSFFAYAPYYLGALFIAGSR